MRDHQSLHIIYIYIYYNYIYIIILTALRVFDAFIIYIIFFCFCVFFLNCKLEYYCIAKRLVPLESCSARLVEINLAITV